MTDRRKDNQGEGAHQPPSMRIRLMRAHLIATILVALVVCTLCYLLSGRVLLTAAIFVIIMAVGVVLDSIIAGQIFGPLESLGDQAQRFAKGERPVVFDVDVANEEIARIETAFNQISSAMSKADDELMAEEARQSQFVSDVSHEIRTPLTAIQGTAETLMDPDMPQSMRERFLTNIIEECQRLTRLANDLLTLQRIEGSRDIELRRINLRSVAESTAITLDALLDDLNVELAIDGEAPDILGNADRIRQVITNLVENASRFAPENGHVRIELSGIKGNSVIAVSDDGPGFGDVDPARLFDRFYRADSSRARGRGTGGTGLGLAIVKAIVDEHDGTVEAFNLPDHGACFIVAFPSLAPAEQQ